MTIDVAKAKLAEVGQEHVLKFWDCLAHEEQNHLLGQIEALNVEEIGRMQRMLKSPAASASSEAFTPAPVVDLEGDEHQACWQRGEELLREGRVGVILVAGGQGSRLGFDGPKGAYEIGSQSGATLFEIHAHKIKALAIRYEHPVPFYIMTSESNDAETRSVFERHAYFGLQPENVHFFVQGMWPALDPDGKIILETPGSIFFSPDGHGGTLSALLKKGMVDDMKARGLTTLFYFQVDNPLIEIADPAFIGLHELRGADISLKVCGKRDPDEGLGVVVVRDDVFGMVEYTELTDAQKRKTLSDGQLWLRYGSIAIHVFSLSFLDQEARKNLPLHVAHKKVAFCDAQGKSVTPSEPNAYKFEKFIFDVLPDAQTVVNLVCSREDEFSPVKNASGADSAASCRADMTEKFARWLEAAGVSVPRNGMGKSAIRIEIDPLYAMGPGDLQKRLPKDFKAEGDLLLN
ncbi:MAG: UDPGP type 1 family protein [Verrucomicrobia bacterium]|nr:UDPGP type 1 family protein [Verrucomicrobiota bacterium]